MDPDTDPDPGKTCLLAEVRTVPVLLVSFMIRRDCFAMLLSSRAQMKTDQDSSFDG